MRAIAGAIVVLAGAYTLVAGDSNHNIFAALLGFTYTALGWLMIVMDYRASGRSAR